MIKSFFFIPATHPQISNKIKEIGADYYIIDLEDAVSKKDFDNGFQNIKYLENKSKLFIRPRLFNDGDLDKLLLHKISSNGFTNLVVPKFKNKHQLRELVNELQNNNCKNYQLLLLIETPESLFNLSNILKEKNINIFGIGFGSEDFCLESGIAHTDELLSQPRFMINLAAKANGIISVDIPTMEINEENKIKKDIQSSFRYGFDAKFFIHPLQIKILNKHEFYSSKEVQEAQLILKEYENAGSPALFVRNGKVIETPHIRNFRKIVNWKNNYAG